MNVLHSEIFRHGFGGQAMVSCDHEDAKAVAAQVFNRLTSRRFDRVGHADEAAEFAIDAHEYHRLALPAQLLCPSHNAGYRYA